MPSHRLLRTMTAFVLASATLARAQSPASCVPALVQPLTLAAAEERMERCNREVRAAALAVDAALADVRIAGQKPNPTLSFGVSNFSPHLGIGAGSLREKTLDQSLHLDQLIE